MKISIEIFQSKITPSPRGVQTKRISLGKGLSSMILLGSYLTFWVNRWSPLAKRQVQVPKSLVFRFPWGRTKPNPLILLFLWVTASALYNNFGGFLG